ncbi:MAG: sulfate adenylyltransferase subunit CysN [Bradymonadia bacterium]
MNEAQALEQMGLEAFLESYRARTVLRFLTCGSVDDGKSTLIGRMLHDARLVFDDHLAALERDSARYGTTGEALDMALLVDGLRAEREQGITIDVAWRYFSTARRRFIIADCPGHVQYTRNMATGASHCQLAVILVDATQGMLEQTRRHAFICSLLGIKHLLIAVNKMDLVDFEAEAFESVRRAFTEFSARLQVDDVQFVPVCAREGDNVVHRSHRMPWYTGSTLLGALETVHVAGDANLIDLRLPVQRVIRPDHTYRGFAGTLAAGILRTGAEVVALPSGKTSTVTGIRTPKGVVDSAQAPQAVAITLADELDLTRGDMIAGAHNTPHLDTELEAMMVWMSEAALTPGRRYWVQHTGRTVPGSVTGVRYAVEMSTLRRRQTDQLELNDIGRVTLRTDQPLIWDPYTRNRTTGAFVLIDRATCATVGAGMLVDRPSAQQRPEGVASSAFALELGPHEALAEQVHDALARWGRKSLLVTPERLAAELNADLEDPRGAEACRRACAVARLAIQSGQPVLCAGFTMPEGDTMPWSELPMSVAELEHPQAVARIIELLEEQALT